MIPTLQDGRTALHYAALNGYTDVTRFLIEKGCNINIQDDVCTTSITNSLVWENPEEIMWFFFFIFNLEEIMWKKKKCLFFIYYTSYKQLGGGI